MANHTGSLPSRLWSLFRIFFHIGLCSIGGGYVMLPMLREEMVSKRAWVTDERLLDYYSIGQATPGIIAINTATFVGYGQAGVLGGVTATVGMVAPSLIIITVIAAFFQHFYDVALVQSAFRGIRVGVAVVLAAMVVELARKNLKDVLGWSLCLAAFGLILVARVSPVPIILAAAAVGLCRHELKRRSQS